MAHIEGTEPLWSTGRLDEKVVTVFTDDPEHVPSMGSLCLRQG